MAELSGTAKLISAVVQGTAGDGKFPYRYLLGTPDQKTVSELHTEMESIYGEAGAELTDEEKETPPTLTEFLTWHSAKQLAYIQYIAGETDNYKGEHEIGSDDDTIHVLLSDDQESIYIIEHLQKSDTGRIPYNDQVNLAATDTWLNTVSIQLGMVPTGTESADTARDSLLTGTTEVTVESVQLILDTSATNFDKEPFTMQLELLTEQLEGQAIFSETTIRERLTALQERLICAQAFYNAAYNDDGTDKQETLSTSTFGPQFDEDSDFVPGETEIDGFVFYRSNSVTYLIMDGNDYGTTGNIDSKTREFFQNELQPGNYMDEMLASDPPWGGVISLDDNAKIKEGYDTFIAQERILATAERSAYDLASTGILNGKQLDAPTLIANLQLLAATRKDALVAIGTAYIDQVQSMLEDFNLFMDALNATTELADTSKPNQEFAFLGLSDRNHTSLTDDQRRAVAMFSSFMRGDALHPVLEVMDLGMLDIELFDVAEKPSFTNPDNGPNTLTRVGDLDSDELAALGLTGLHNNDYVSKVSQAPWEWQEKTKTEWDSIITRLNQNTQSIMSNLDIKRTEVEGDTKMSTQLTASLNNYMQMVQSTISRITFLG